MGEKTVLEVWKEFGFETRAKIIDICEYLIGNQGSRSIDRTLLRDIKDLPEYQSTVIYYVLRTTIVKRQNAAKSLEQAIVEREFWFYE